MLRLCYAGGDCLWRCDAEDEDGAGEDVLLWRAEKTSQSARTIRMMRIMMIMFFDSFSNADADNFSKVSPVAKTHLELRRATGSSPV